MRLGGRQAKKTRFVWVLYSLTVVPNEACSVQGVGDACIAGCCLTDIMSEQSVPLRPLAEITVVDTADYIM